MMLVRRWPGTAEEDRGEGLRGRGGQGEGGLMGSKNTCPFLLDEAVRALRLRLLLMLLLC